MQDGLTSKSIKSLKNFFVLGAGASGLAAASLLLSHGKNVAVCGPCHNADACKSLFERGCVVHNAPVMDVLKDMENHEEDFACIDAVVISPGFAYDSEEVNAFKKWDIPVLGELQLGLIFGKEVFSKVLFVTGSKGKSSVVKFLSDTLNLCGYKAVPCGNYGRAVCDVAEKEHDVIAVVECSSFQMESVVGEDDIFSSDGAILLNLSHDHMDRHKTMTVYRDEKLKCFRGCRGVCLIPYENEYDIESSFVNLYGKRPTIFVGNREEFDALGDNVGKTAFYENSAIVYYDGSVEQQIPIKGSYFDNEILGRAASAATLLLLDLGLSNADIEKGFSSFKPLSHRMEKVGEKDGVVFVDDSKATSVSALLAGCKMSKKPVFLIAGGRLKEKIEISCKELVTIGVKKVYLIGECSKEMYLAWSEGVDIALCEVMSNAVKLAYNDALEYGGGTVLLSPGTASFDQYSSYGERGKDFVNNVRIYLNLNKN